MLGLLLPFAVTSRTGFITENLIKKKKRKKKTSNKMMCIVNVIAV